MIQEADAWINKPAVAPETTTRPILPRQVYFFSRDVATDKHGTHWSIDVVVGSQRGADTMAMQYQEPVHQIHLLGEVLKLAASSIGRQVPKLLDMCARFDEHMKVEMNCTLAVLVKTKQRRSKFITKVEIFYNSQLWGEADFSFKLLE